MTSNKRTHHSRNGGDMKRRKHNDSSVIPQQMPSDVHGEDAMVLLEILQTHTHTRFRRKRKYEFWNDVIRACDPVDGRITQLSLFEFDEKHRVLPPPVSSGTVRENDTKSTRLLSRLEKLQKLELRNCRSLPVDDLPRMKSLTWFNLCILDSVAIPHNRDWYPPNLKTFLIYGYKVKGDPLDALIATSIVMQCPPIEMEDYDSETTFSYHHHHSGISNHNNHRSSSSSNGVKSCAENDIADVLLSDGIVPFCKYDKTGRISELRLSSVIRNPVLQRSLAVPLPPSIGRLQGLQKLYLYKVSSLPPELSHLAHLKVLRLDGCDAEDFWVHPSMRLPSVTQVQLRGVATKKVLDMVTTCFPNLRSLEILGVYPPSLENVFASLGRVNSKAACCFQKSLIKLHVSVGGWARTPVPYLVPKLMRILQNHPKLSKLYVERVDVVGKDTRVVNPSARIEMDRKGLESAMTTLLEAHPRLRGLSIGGPNVFSFDNRQRRGRRLGNGSRSIEKAYTKTDVLLNLNRCGRVLLNQVTTYNNASNESRGRVAAAAPVSRWIPASVWPRVLERAQRIPYAGMVRCKKDRKIQEMGALYFLLRNGPALALREQFGFEFLAMSRQHDAKITNSGAAANACTGGIPSKISVRRGSRKRKQRCVQSEENECFSWWDDCQYY